MWISKNEYKKLTNEIQNLKVSLDNAKDFRDQIVTLLKQYRNDNENLTEQIEELKVKYADEVNKNFELAQFLSQTKIEKGFKL